MCLTQTARHPRTPRRDDAGTVGELGGLERPRGLTAAGKQSAVFQVNENKDGKAVYKATYTVSPDGKTLTEVGGAAGVNEKTTAVYDRQQPQSRSYQYKAARGVFGSVSNTSFTTVSVSFVLVDRGARFSAPTISGSHQRITASFSRSRWLTRKSTHTYPTGCATGY